MKRKTDKTLELMEFQKAGVKALLKRPHNILADEMGLGKTVQAIKYLEYLHLPDNANILIICPAHLRLVWYNELQLWYDDKSFTIDVIQSASKVKSIAVSLNGGSPDSTRIIITSYNLASSAKIHKNLMSLKFELLILDEAHYLKNPKSARTKKILGVTTKKKKLLPSIADRCIRKLALTGTPVPNRPIELYPLLSRLLPQPFYEMGYWNYALKYANARETKWGWDVSGASNLSELRAILSKYLIIRRLKKHVLDELPAKTRQVIVLEPDNEAKTLLKKEAEYNIQDIRKTLNQGKLPIHFEEMSMLRRLMALSKAKAVLQHIEDMLESTTKLVVFAWHRDLVDLLEEELNKKEIKTVKYYGSMTDSKKQESVDSFQSDSQTRVFIGNIQAAGTGITLTASSTVIFAELDWVPGNLSQAEDRCHRISQKDNVLVQHLVYDGSIDHNLLEAIFEKQSVIERII